MGTPWAQASATHLIVAECDTVNLVVVLLEAARGKGKSGGKRRRGSVRAVIPGDPWTRPVLRQARGFRSRTGTALACSQRPKR